MKVISSQHFIDFEIVERKMEEMKNAKIIEVPCRYVGFIDGTEYAMQSDKHHTLAAARELGVPFKFVISDDSEGLEGLNLLDQRYVDGDWYNVETSDPAYDRFDLIW